MSSAPIASHSKCACIVNNKHIEKFSSATFEHLSTRIFQCEKTEAAFTKISIELDRLWDSIFHGWMQAEDCEKNSENCKVAGALRTVLHFKGVAASNARHHGRNAAAESANSC